MLKLLQWASSRARTLCTIYASTSTCCHGRVTSVVKSRKLTPPSLHSRTIRQRLRPWHKPFFVPSYTISCMQCTLLQTLQRVQQVLQGVLPSMPTFLMTLLHGCMWRTLKHPRTQPALLSSRLESWRWIVVDSKKSWWWLYIIRTLKKDGTTLPCTSYFSEVSSLM